MTSMLCGLVCVVLLSGLTALAGGQQGESGYTLVCKCISLYFHAVGDSHGIIPHADMFGTKYCSLHGLTLLDTYFLFSV